MLNCLLNRGKLEGNVALNMLVKFKLMERTTFHTNCLSLYDIQELSTCNHKNISNVKQVQLDFTIRHCLIVCLLLFGNHLLFCILNYSHHTCNTMLLPRYQMFIKAFFPAMQHGFKSE